MNFSEVSKNLRKEKNLSQVQLAEALNVSKACISMIEIGKNEPTANTLIRYADFFECSTDFLLGREDDFGNVVVQNFSPSDSLRSDERELIANFRKIPEDLQRRATAYLKKLVELNEEELSPGDSKKFQ